MLWGPLQFGTPLWTAALPVHFFGKEICAHGAGTNRARSYGTRTFKHAHWMIQHDSHNTSIYNIFTYIIIFKHIIRDNDWRKYDFKSKKVGFLVEW